VIVDVQNRGVFLVLATSLLSILVSCSTSNTKTSTANAVAGKQDVSEILSKYSDQQLRQFMGDRRNKSIGDNSPADLKRISDEEIIDYVIYRQKSLYGTDRRREFWEVQDPIQLQVANSVAALVTEQHYKELSKSYQLIGKPLGEVAELCSGEHFYSQPVIANCSGFVVGPDLVATAGHCVPKDLTSLRIVFGYRAIRPANDVRIVTEIPKSQVYRVLEAVSQRYDGPNIRTIDYAVLRVDRKIVDHLQLPLDTKEGVKTGDELYVLGFPSGLPLKLADQAFVRSVSDKGYFVSNLDTFGGNSGSPVLKDGTLIVEGILVRGDNDYAYRGKCQVTLVCPRDGTDCRNDGEDATSIPAIADVFGSANATAFTEKAVLIPVTKTFSGEDVLSGTMKSFSPEYTIISDPPPPGYKIASYNPSLTGDRVCNSYSTCRATVEGDRVVFRFSTQGHNEWPFPGQAKSQGHLVVTYAPK
jgi:hypothetical protein